jgi:hypothetical protein
MRIKFIEQIKFRLKGRAVPVIVALDIDKNGRIGALHLAGEMGKRDNSIINPWDEHTYEIDRDAQVIPVLNEKGIATNTHIVSESGKTINIYTTPRREPSARSILGRFSMADDIADNMVLGKSMKNLVIGLLVGLAIGTFFLGPMVQAMMK